MSTSDSRTVQSCGARGDGVSDDGEAIQRALSAGSGEVLMPAGDYLVGRVLRIGSGTRLKLAPGARLRLADGVAREPGDYFLTNANPATGDADIAVEGGRWDGNNAGNARPPGLFDHGCSGALMHFQNVRGLLLADLHLHDAEAYHVRLTQTRDFRIERIRFSADRVRPNNDGIHLGGHCEHGVIRDIKGLHPGVTGDDMIALNADDALSRTEVKGMTCGPIRDILVEDIAAEGCHSFVRLLSVVSPIENIRIRGVRGTCEVAAINCDGARGCLVPVFDEKNPPFPDGVGFLNNIDASDFLVGKSHPNDVALLRLETRMTNVRIANFVRDLSNDHAPAAPTLRLRHVAVGRLSVDGGEPLSLAFGETLERNDAAFRELLINPVSKLS